MKKLKPDWLIVSPLMITPESLIQKGIRALIIDVDNTLIPWHQKQVDVTVKTWVEQIISAGIQIVLLSNNTTKRIEPIAQQLQLPYVANAKKPSAYGVKKAMSLLNVAYESIVLIGDQLLTDISAAKKAKLKTVLVKPLGGSDMIPTKMTRLIEAIALKKYKKNDRLDWRTTLE